MTSLSRVKSFMLARTKALTLHRAETRPLEIADLQLDTDTRIATRGTIRLDLTTREFDLLLYLAENRGRTVSREMLAKDVWHETARFTPNDNVIDVQMTRLRRKVDDPFPIKLLHTIRGVGFILREPQP